MRNRIIALVVLVCVMTLSILAAVLFKDKIAPDPGTSPLPTPEPDERVEIFNFSREDAMTLTIKAPGKEDVIIGHTVKTEGEDKTDVWTYIPDESVVLDSVECSTVFGVMSDLKGRKLEEDVIKDATLEDFGLHEPVVVTVLMNDGKTEYKIEVGDFTSTRDGAYAKLPDKDDIYIISQGAALYLTSEKKDFVNKRLFEKGEDEDIEYIKLVKDGKTQFVLVSSKMEGEEILNWKVIEPIEWDVNIGDATLFVDTFTSISAEEVLGDTDDLEQYGLKNPRYNITFKVNGKEYKILLGKTDENGSSYYGMWNDNKEIYKFPVQYFKEIDTPLNRILNQVVYGPNYAELSKLEIMIDNKNYVFNIKNAEQGKTEKDVLEFQGKTFTDTDNPEVTAAFRTVYKGALGLWVNGVDIDAKPTGTPEIKIIFTNKKLNETVTVEYIKKDETYYYIIKNGKYTGLLTEIDNTNNEITDIVGDIPGVRPALKHFMEKIQ